jgi:CDP-diacylglycerol--glycerol-3-phosphate 3-phosphatidyltransferase/cardiolipin synthase
MMTRQVKAIIPNLLSLCRLVIACVFPFCPPQLWIWLILAGGSSDVLDGWLARRWQVTSWQGGLLDAVADKAFVVSALTTLSYAGYFSLWWIPAVLARDLTVALIAAYTASVHSWESFQQMGARVSGKFATAGQFLLLLAAVLFQNPVPGVLLFTIACSLVAAGDYSRVFYQRMRNRGTAE